MKWKSIIFLLCIAVLCLSLLFIPIARASPDSVSDGFTDETKIASKNNVYVNTADGNVRLALSTIVTQQWNETTDEGSGCSGYAIGDCDNDGDNEIFLSKAEGLAIYDWNGTDYELNTTLASGHGPTGFVCGDVDGDSENELVVGWMTGDCVTVYDWNGAEYGLTKNYTFSHVTYVYDVNIGDVNNDATYNEIVICNDPDATEADKEIVVLEYNGAGDYVVNGTYDVPSHNLTVMCGIGDLDGDGANEIAFSNYYSIYVIGWSGSTYTLDYSKDLGDDIYGVAVGDVDGDNKEEIFFSNLASSNNAKIWLYGWNGTSYEEQDSVLWASDKRVIEGIDIGNLDDDNTLELVATVATKAYVLFWNGTGLEEESYSPIGTFSEGSTQLASIGDADNDGLPELVIGVLEIEAHFVYELVLEDTGTIYSTNLLSGQSVSTVDSFNYTISSLPAQTSAEALFSQDNATWYNSTGGSDWQSLSSGTNNTIDLSTLGWTSANFYYLFGFNNTDDDTSKLNYISIIFTSVTSDTEKPTYENVGKTTTIAGYSCKFYTRWSDNVSMSGYIFGTNNTGSWRNDTLVSWSPMGTPKWSNVTKALNSTVDVTIQWRIWAKDTSDNWNNTGIQSFLTTSPPPVAQDPNNRFNLYFQNGHTLAFQHLSSYSLPEEYIINITVTSGTLNGTNGQLSVTWLTGDGELSFTSQDTATVSAPKAAILVNGERSATGQIQTGDKVRIIWSGPILEPFFPLMFAIGMIGLVALFIGPLYAINEMKKHRYYSGFVYGLMITAIGFGLFLAWLWG